MNIQEPSNLGELLTAERTRANLSIADVANKLHLKVDLIEKFEANQFDETKLASIFLRGYIRSYGKLVGLSDDIIDKALDHAGLNNQELKNDQKTVEKHTQAEPSALAEQAKGRGAKVVLYIALVIVLIMLAIYWHHSHQSPIHQTPAISDSVAQQIQLNDKAKLEPDTTNNATISAALPEQGIPEETMDDINE